MRRHSMMNLISLALAICLVAPWGLVLCEAAGADAAAAAPSAVRFWDGGESPAGAGADEDMFFNIIASISQFIANALAFDPAGNTSAISSWNH